MSRTAGMRGLSLSGFCSELGLSLKKLIKFDDRQTKAIAKIFDLPGQEIQEMMSWTPQPTAGVQVCFRGEEFVSRALINPVVRGCPACNLAPQRLRVKWSCGETGRCGTWKFACAIASLLFRSGKSHRHWHDMISPHTFIVLRMTSYQEVWTGHAIKSQAMTSGWMTGFLLAQTRHGSLRSLPIRLLGSANC